MIKKFLKGQVNNFQRFTGNYELVKINTINQAVEYDRLKDQIKQKTPLSLALHGKKVYSQTDEDGIIEEIFNRIPNNKTFIEIGIETGIECNTLYLLLKGWKGFWVEGSPEDYKTITTNLGGHLFSNRLSVLNSFIERENILDIFDKAYSFFNTKEIDFFSLDIDGNDYYIMERLLVNGHFPKVVCVEYNAKFPPPLSLKIEYDKTFVWEGADYAGCSLQAYVDLFAAYKYHLVCCNIPGINAFFVREDFIHLFTTYSTSELHQPPRFYLSPINLGQKGSLRWLRDQLNNSGNS